MTTTPHLDIDQDPGGRARHRSAGTSRWQKTVGILGLVVVFWVGDRLNDTIASDGSGPGGDHQPSGGTPTTQPADGDEPAPGDTGDHDPSQFDHG
jgi:hypothetical protein